MLEAKFATARRTDIIESTTVQGGVSVGRPEGVEVTRVVGTQLASAAIFRRRAFNVVRHVMPTSLASFSFALIVVLPTIIASVYLIGWASNRYVSEFRIAVRTIDTPKLGGLSDLFGMSGTSRSGNDSYAIVQYLQSRESFNELNKSVAVREMFSSEKIDLFSRISADKPVEEFERYWNKRINTNFEPTTGTITVQASAFKPEDAFIIAKTLKSQVESFVNRLSEKVRRDSLEFAEREVVAAKTRLSEYRQRQREMQDKEHMLDPYKSAESNLALAAKLREEISRLRATLITQKIQLGADAPSVRSTANNVQGMEQELARIEAQATATNEQLSSAQSSLSAKIGKFQQLTDEKEFAEKAYMSALSSLEAARVDAERNQIYLATIVSPGTPEEPTFPHPSRDIGAVFGIALAIWFIGALGVYSVREHM